MGIQINQLSQLAIQFDNYVLNSAKSVDPQFLKYHRRNEPLANKLSIGESEQQIVLSKQKIPMPDNLRPPKYISSILSSNIDRLPQNNELQLLPSFVLNAYNADVKEKLNLEKKKNQASQISIQITSETQNISQYDLQQQGTLLPFSSHSKQQPPQLWNDLNISYENPSIHEQILERAESEELRIKYEILRNHSFHSQITHGNIRIIGEHLHNIRRKYRDNLRDYYKQLKQFCQDYKHEVDLERTKLLLRTTPLNLKQIEKKEEYEFKRMKKKKTALQTYSVKDHLPFGTVILNIAAQMPKSPAKPQLKIKINQETFKAYLEKYYKSFKIIYQRFSYEHRIDAMNAIKAKKMAQKFNSIN